MATLIIHDTKILQTTLAGGLLFLQTNMVYYNILLNDVIALDHKQSVKYLDRRGSIQYLIGLYTVFDGRTKKINKTQKYIVGTRFSCSVAVCLIPLTKKDKKVATFICLILFKTFMQQSIPLFYVRPNIFPINLCLKQNGHDGRRTTTRSNLSML